ncbi:MAG: hypothetical protein ACI8P9_004230, partial [Parasphingorhabdus sp.]
SAYIQWLKPANYAAFIKPETYLQWANPENYAEFLNAIPSFTVNVTSQN